MIIELSTALARTAIAVLCLVIVVTAPRRSVRLLGAIGALLMVVSVTLLLTGSPLVSG